MQAVLIADNNVWNFKPLSDEGSTVCIPFTNNLCFPTGHESSSIPFSLQALLPLVNVSMLDYALIALNRSGVEEVFVYASLYLQDVRDHIK